MRPTATRARGNVLATTEPSPDSTASFRFRLGLSWPWGRMFRALTPRLHSIDESKRASAVQREVYGPLVHEPEESGMFSPILIIPNTCSLASC